MCQKRLETKASVPLARCLSCAHYRGLDGEAEGGPGALQCDVQVSSLLVVSPSGEVVGLSSAAYVPLWPAQTDGSLTRVRRCESP